MSVLPGWATSPKDVWHCSACGEECPEVTEWCEALEKGVRHPAHSIHVRWTAEVIHEADR